jgi:hypothetical protein
MTNGNAIVLCQDTFRIPKSECPADGDQQSQQNNRSAKKIFYTPLQMGIITVFTDNFGHEFPTQRVTDVYKLVTNLSLTYTHIFVMMLKIAKNRAIY